MEHEVDVLRSLAVEMTNAKIMTEEAKDGLKIIKAFLKPGVNLEKHQCLIKACSVTNDQDFIQVTIELTEIEDSLGLNYEEAVERFKELESEIPVLKHTQQKLDQKIW